MLWKHYCSFELWFLSFLEIYLDQVFDILPKIYLIVKRLFYHRNVLTLVYYLFYICVQYYEYYYGANLIFSLIKNFHSSKLFIISFKIFHQLLTVNILERVLHTSVLQHIKMGATHYAGLRLEDITAPLQLPCRVVCCIPNCFCYYYVFTPPSK